MSTAGPEMASTMPPSGEDLRPPRLEPHEPGDRGPEDGAHRADADAEGGDDARPSCPRRRAAGVDRLPGRVAAPVGLLGRLGESGLGLLVLGGGEAWRPAPRWPCMSRL